jgi:hypothetical protein
VAAVILFCEGHEHGRTAPRGPTFGGPIGDSENSGYLCVGEPLHVPQDQRGPVLDTHVAERGLYLLPLLRTKGSRFRVGVASARFWQDKC